MPRSGLSGGQAAACRRRSPRAAPPTARSSYRSSWGVVVLSRRYLQPEAIGGRGDEDDARRRIGRWRAGDVHAARAARTVMRRARRLPALPRWFGGAKNGASASRARGLGERQLLDLRRVVDQVRLRFAPGTRTAPAWSGCGCVGASFSPGTFDGGTGFISIGQIGSPVCRLNE